jgi:hypothetical protein
LMCRLDLWFKTASPQGGDYCLLWCEAQGEYTDDGVRCRLPDVVATLLAVGAASEHNGCCRPAASKAGLQRQPVLRAARAYRCLLRACCAVAILFCSLCLQAHQQTTRDRSLAVSKLGRHGQAWGQGRRCCSGGPLHGMPAAVADQCSGQLYA